MESTVAYIYDRSEFMRLRSKTMQREINEIQNRVSGKSQTRQVLDASFFYLIAKAQMLVDVPTWIGAYEKAMADPSNARADGSVDEERAARLADQAVLDSQGGGQVKDLAGVQRGGPLMKLWTTFYSFFNVAYNLMAESVGETKLVGPKRLPLMAVDFLMLAIVPAALGYFLRAAMRGDWPEDDEELAKDLAREQLSYLTGTMVGLREAGSAIAGFEYRGVSGLRFFAEGSKLVKEAQDGEVDEAFLKAANNTAGIVFHYPAGQVQRTTQGVVALADGRTRNPMAVVTGPAREARQ